MFSQRTVVGAAALLLASASSLAQDACPCGTGNRVTNAALLTALLANKTVCASVGGEAWQEFHSGSTAAGGPLIDYKKGPTDPVDPSETVGSWAVTPGSGSVRSGTVVTYNYGAGGTYQYQVCDAGGGSVNFCSGARNITGARLLNGQLPCNAATRASTR